MPPNDAEWGSRKGEADHIKAKCSCVHTWRWVCLRVVCVEPLSGAPQSRAVFLRAVPWRLYRGRVAGRTGSSSNRWRKKIQSVLFKCFVTSLLIFLSLPHFLGCSRAGPRVKSSRSEWQSCSIDRIYRGGAFQLINSFISWPVTPVTHTTTSKLDAYRRRKQKQMI